MNAIQIKLQAQENKILGEELAKVRAKNKADAAHQIKEVDDKFFRMFSDATCNRVADEFGAELIRAYYLGDTSKQLALIKKMIEKEELEIAEDASEGALEALSDQMLRDVYDRNFAMQWGRLA
jgi:hypothetical protein